MPQRAHEMYGLSVPERREWIFRWFHNGRVESFAELIESDGGKALSVGCGNGVLEKDYLNSAFDSIIGIDMRREMCENAEGVEAIQCVAPPLPFSASEFDAVIASGIIEHTPDEHGFLKECKRVLSWGGALYLTVPIEVGIGGFIRHLGKNFVHPTHGEYVNGWRRYFDFTLEELFAQSPREKHGTGHRFFNYRHTFRDLRSLFNDVTRTGWPVPFGRNANLFYFIRARVD